MGQEELDILTNASILVQEDKWQEALASHQCESIVKMQVDLLNPYEDREWAKRRKVQIATYRLAQYLINRSNPSRSHEGISI